MMRDLVFCFFMFLSYYFRVIGYASVALISLRLGGWAFSGACFVGTCLGFGLGLGCLVVWLGCRRRLWIGVVYF